MQIKDSCPCGSRIEIETTIPSEAGYRHQAWLVSHGRCIEAHANPPADERPDGWIIQSRGRENLAFHQQLTAGNEMRRLSYETIKPFKYINENQPFPPQAGDR